MAKKTAVRRLAKMLPLSPAAIAAIKYDDEQNFDFNDSSRQPEMNVRRKQSADSLVDAMGFNGDANDADEATDVEVVDAQ